MNTEATISNNEMIISPIKSLKSGIFETGTHNYSNKFIYTTCTPNQKIKEGDLYILKELRRFQIYVDSLPREQDEEVDHCWVDIMSDTDLPDEDDSDDEDYNFNDDASLNYRVEDDYWVHIHPRGKIFQRNTALPLRRCRNIKTLVSKFLYKDSRANQNYDFRIYLQKQGRQEFKYDQELNESDETKLIYKCLRQINTKFLPQLKPEKALQSQITKLSICFGESRSWRTNCTTNSIRGIFSRISSLKYLKTLEIFAPDQNFIYRDTGVLGNTLKYLNNVEDLSLEIKQSELTFTYIPPYNLEKLKTLTFDDDYDQNKGTPICYELNQLPQIENLNVPLPHYQPEIDYLYCFKQLKTLTLQDHCLQEEFQEFVDFGKFLFLEELSISTLGSSWANEYSPKSLFSSLKNVPSLKIFKQCAQKVNADVQELLEVISECKNLKEFYLLQGSFEFITKSPGLIESIIKIVQGQQLEVMQISLYYSSFGSSTKEECPQLKAITNEQLSELRKVVNEQDQVKQFEFIIGSSLCKFNSINQYIKIQK